MSNDEVKRVFLLRSQIVREIRAFLHDRGFVEVETPMMQAIPGGAAAQAVQDPSQRAGLRFLPAHRPRTLSQAPAGGRDRPRLRDRTQLPQRRTLPQAQPRVHHARSLPGLRRLTRSMMELVQGLVCHVAQKVLGTLLIEHKNPAGDWSGPSTSPRPGAGSSTRTSSANAPAPTGSTSRPTNAARGRSSWAPTSPSEYEDFEVTQAVFEKLIEPTLINPTFVTHAPKELIPLAKLSPDDPTTVEVFECCINGQEIAPGLHRTERSHRAARAARTPGRRRTTETRRGFPGRARTRHAAGRRHGPRHRPPLHDAPGPGEHPRCHPVPPTQAQRRLMVDGLMVDGLRLTPTLSPGERETVRPRSANSFTLGTRSALKSPGSVPDSDNTVVCSGSDSDAPTWLEFLRQAAESAVCDRVRN